MSFQSVWCYTICLFFFFFHCKHPGAGNIIIAWHGNRTECFTGDEICTVVKEKCPLHSGCVEMLEATICHEACQSLLDNMSVSTFTVADFQTLVPLGEMTLQFQATFIATDLKKLWCCHEWSLFKRRFADVPPASVPTLPFGAISPLLIEVSGVSNPLQTNGWSSSEDLEVQQGKRKRQVQSKSFEVMCFPITARATCSCCFSIHLFIGLLTKTWALWKKHFGGDLIHFILKSSNSSSTLFFLSISIVTYKADPSVYHTYSLNEI